MSIEHETLTSLFTDIANAIRSRTGGSAVIQADEFPDAIAAIDIHQGVETNKAVTITSLSQEVTPSSGYYSMAKVTASVRAAAAIALVGVAVTDVVIVGTESSGYYPISAKIKGNVTVGTTGWYTGSSNLVAASNSQVGKIAKAVFTTVGNMVGCTGAGYVVGDTTVGIVDNGTATVQSRTSGGTAVGYGQEVSLSAGYYSAVKFYNSISAGTIDVTDLTITPNALTGSWNSTTEKYVVSQASKTATMQSVVTSAGYVSSSVGTKNTGTATVSAPTSLEIPKATFGNDGPIVGCNTAGYVPTGAIYTIPLGTEGTPTATKGTASSYSISVTPSVTNVAGYIEGGTHTGTVVTVNPTDLGLTLKTALSRSGGTVSLAAGSYNTSALSVTVTAENLGLTKKTALSKSGGTVSLAANSYNTSALSVTVTATDLGLTLRSSLSKSGGTVSIAANSYNTSALSVTVTRSDLGITDKAAATYNPSTSDQTISSGYYLTGTQTIKGITAITNSTYSGYLTSSTTARTTTIKTISGPTTADIYIYPSTSIYNYWANTYGLKISKPTQMTLPSTPALTSSGTQKAVITPGNSALYINIPVGYNSTAVYYKINSAMPLAYSFMISDQESHYYGQGFESYPMFTGMTWAMAINAGISFYGIPIVKDGGLLVVNDGPYAGRPLMDEKYNVVDPSDVIQANSFYMFENE